MRYAVDASSEVDWAFDRLAYYLELQPVSGAREWVYVSMDAFTDDVGRIGVPSFASGAVWQQLVSDMNVFSNDPDIGEMKRAMAIVSKSLTATIASGRTVPMVIN